MPRREYLQRGIRNPLQHSDALKFALAISRLQAALIQPQRRCQVMVLGRIDFRDHVGRLKLMP